VSRVRRAFWPALAAILAAAGPALADRFDPIGVQKVLVIPVEYGIPFCPFAHFACPPVTGYLERIAPSRNTADQWRDFLDTQINRYYRRSTYGQTTFEFTVLRNPSSTDGWWAARHSVQEYYLNGKFVARSLWDELAENPYVKIGLKSPPAPSAVVPDNARYVIDKAIELGLVTADQVAQHTRLIVIDNYHGHGGQTFTGIFTLKTTRAGTLQFTANILSESFDDFDALGAAVHELGHHFFVKTHYGHCNKFLTPPLDPEPFDSCLRFWDPMGQAEPNRHQFTAETLLNVGWEQPEVTATVPIGRVGTSQEVVLGPIESRPAARPNILRLPVGVPRAGFDGYLAECRQQIGVDVTIPTAGLLITQVHENVPGVPAVNLVRPTGPGDTDHISDAPLQPGESFVDARLGLTVTLESYDTLPPPSDDPTLAITSVSNCRVLVAYAPPLWVDLAFLKSDLDGAFRGAGFGFRSGDVWIDSPRNGLGVFPDRQPVEQHAGIAMPAGPGDPPASGRENRIWFRVRNGGTGVAENVQLDVAVSQPAVVAPVCGAAAPGGRVVGTVTIPTLGPGEEHLASVAWTPRSRDPAQVQVRLHAVPGDFRTDDDVATSTVGYASPPGRSGRARHLHLRVANPSACGEPRRFLVVPGSADGVAVTVRPGQFSLRPGKTRTVSLTIRGGGAGVSAELPISVLVSEPQGYPPTNQPVAPYPAHAVEVIGGLDLVASGEAAPSPPLPSSPPPAPTCGDGVVVSPEECDGNDQGGKTCQDFNFVGGGLICRPDCTLDTSQCIPAQCGNQQCEAGETCGNCPPDCGSC
jgi:hypothetical protein